MSVYASSLILMNRSRGVFASFADWLCVDMPHYVYEGDQVVVRCFGENYYKIKRLMYYKDGYHITTYPSASSYFISNVRPSDSSSYYCKADRKLFLFVDTTEETRSIWLTVQAGDSGMEQDLCGRTRVRGRGDHQGGINA